MKQVLARFAGRYIAGTTREEALEVVRGLNASGISTTLDILGENVNTADGARASAAEYITLLEEIDRAGLDSSVSVKLTHLGLDISTELATENAEGVVRKAGEYGNLVCMDMEGSAHTARTIDIALDLGRRQDNLRVAVQSYLKRSADDVDRLIRKGVSVRLVKGAYKEPPEVAFAEKERVDRNFVALMRLLMVDGKDPAIATHDESILDDAKKFALIKGIRKDSFEIQMLLGIKRTLQKDLAKEGYRMRVYVPYGPDWLPYMTRRLTERKENLYFVLKNIVD